MELLTNSELQENNFDFAKTSYAAKMLYLLRGEKSLDRMELARRLGVTWPTASNTAEKLLNARILITQVQEPSSDSANAKNTYSLMVNPNYGYFAGISIGSSEIKIVVLDFNFHVLTHDALENYLCVSDPSSDDGSAVLDWRRYLVQKSETEGSYIKFPTPESADRFSATVNQIISGLIKADKNQSKLPVHQSKRLLGIGFAFTGAVNVENKVVTESFNLPFLRGTSYTTLITPSNREYLERCNIYVSFQHNAKTVAIAEKYYLQKNHFSLGNCENIVCIYLGSGISCGMILNNRLFSGSKNYSGELGHIPFLMGGNQVLTLEEYIRIYVFGEPDFDTYRRNSLEDLQKKLNHSSEARDRFAQAIGCTINTVANMFNPGLIILSGKLSVLAKACLDNIYSYQFSALPYIFDSYKLQISEQGICAPAIGAAMYAFYARYNLDVEF